MKEIYKGKSDAYIQMQADEKAKKELAKMINATLEPMREKRKYYEQHPELVDEILIKGTEKARQTAKETMKKVKQAMKLDYFE